MMKKVGIIGCGWLGLRIAERLSANFEVYTTTTTPDKAKSLKAKGFHTEIISFTDQQLSQKSTQWYILNDLDVLIITIPLSQKNCCASSLYNKLQNLFSFINDYNGQLFFTSSTSVYPDLTEEFTEEHLPIDQVSVERMIKNKYPQINILRLAGLMGDQRLLSKYKVSNLDYAVNHVHYADVCSVIEEMIKQQSHARLYNVVAPLHPTKSEVIHAQKNSPTLQKIEPKGKKVSSSKLISELDFKFQYGDPRYFHQESFI